MSNSKHLVSYVPHGIDEDQFFPIDENFDRYKEFLQFKSDLFEGKDIEFVVFFNSRNIRRKSIPDTIMAYRLFCDKIGKEKSRKCALLLHTDPVNDNGTDLKAVKNAFCDPDYINVYFSANKLTTEQMNLLYNVGDVTILLSSNEGWGLSLTESMMTGTMIIPNVTGGMQDQCRFEDSKGNWINFNPDFPSNHRGDIKKCGEWAIPVFPSSVNIQGSPPTPYIFDDRVSPEDGSEAILEVFNLSPKERKERGLKGREWVTSEESGMTSKNMARGVIRSIDKVFEEFTPRPTLDLVKVQDRKPQQIPHRLTDYSYE